MKHSIAHSLANQHSDNTPNCANPLTDNPKPSPANKILDWYNSQKNQEVLAEFTGLISFFHPDESIETELNPKLRCERFKAYLAIPQTERREIVRKTLSIIGSIDLVIDSKQREEHTLGIPDIINLRWSEWSKEWKRLRRSTLMNHNIRDWFFRAKSL